MTQLNAKAGSAGPRIRRATSASRKKTFWLTTMMLPAAIWLLLIRYLPMFGIMMSFLDYKLPTRKVPRSTC